MVEKCYLCKGELISTKDIILKNGKAFSTNVKQCDKCGHSFSTLEEIEKLRKEMNPSFLEKIKRFVFNANKIESLSFFKGKVL